MIYEIGKFLGGGGYKKCFLVKGNLKKVLLIPRDPTEDRWVITNEHRCLERLRKAKVPALKTKIVKVWYQGRKVRALLADRYDGNTWRATRGKRFKSFKLIADRLEKARLAVDDMQFLVKKNGKVVISDPLGLERIYKHQENWSVNYIRNELKLLPEHY
jgi:hypothetical protein